MDRDAVWLAIGSLPAKDKALVVRYVGQLENLLDLCDEDDLFGTEGWKHRLGLD